MLVPAASNRAEPLDATLPDLIVNGAVENSLAGRSVAFADLDGDKVGDLIVGAPSDSSNGHLSGKVMICLGGANGDSAPDVEIAGSAGERFGWSVAFAGDVNDDGYDDIVVGAYDNDDGDINVGAAYIFFGSDDVGTIPDRSADADVIISGTEARGWLGYSVATAGDINADGYDDVLIGAPNNGAGKVLLFYGGPSMGGEYDDSDADKTFYGTTTGDMYGYSIAGGLNLDGSAEKDIVVGIPKSSSEKGAVQVILNVAKATPKTVMLTGDSTGDQFGTSVAVGGFNGDDSGDVAVGAPYAESVGKAYIFHGSTLTNRFDRNADVVLSEGSSGDWFGFSIAAGDPRTDGVDDLVVGAPFNDGAGKDTGCAYVFHWNETFDDVSDVLVQGLTVSGNFGWAVASGDNTTADFSADLAADFAVGAPLNGTDRAGAVFVFNGTRIAAPSPPTIYGYVFDGLTKDPIQGAIVNISDGASVLETVRTSQDGSYGVDDIIAVPPGTYWVNASYKDHFPDSHSDVALSYDSRTRLNFTLDWYPVVNGTIFDGNSTGPLEGALVEVRDDSEKLLDSLTTDETGEYSFMLEVECEITISVSMEDYFDNSTTLSIERNDTITQNITLEHMPVLVVTVLDNGTATPKDAVEGALVAVLVDDEVVESGTTDSDGIVVLIVDALGDAVITVSMSGYLTSSTDCTLEENTMDEDIVVLLDRRPTIEGTVSDGLLGFPIRYASVELFKSATGTLLATVPTDRDGYYAFEMVDTGAYDLRVEAIGYLVDYRLNLLVESNEAVAADFALISDDIPPVSEISDPKPETVMTDVEFLIWANATDPNGNEILSVALYYSYASGAYKYWNLDNEAPYVFTFNTSDAMGDGVYSFYTKAWDCAQNEEPAPSVNDTWIIMNSGLPVSSVDDDALNPYYSTDTFTVTATASDPFGVQCVELWYSFDGGEYSQYGEDDVSPYEWEFDSSTDGDGEYGFYSIMVNGLDQRELVPDDADAVTFVDTTAPTVTISSPSEGEIIPSESVSLSVQVEDAGTGLASVMYQVDSEDPVAVDVDEGAAECDITETLTLSDGLHTVTITAEDVPGWETVGTVNFTIDTAAPSISDIEPADGSAVNTSDVTITWSVSDEGSGIDLMKVKVDTGSWETVTEPSYLAEDLDDGTYTAYIYVEDVAGNEKTASTTFEVDTIAPTVLITMPEEGDELMTSTVVVRWEQSDIGAGLDHAEVSLDAGDPVYPAVVNETTFESVSEGTHTVEVTLFDLAGNWDTDSVTFDVDGTAPVISITTPEDGEMFGSNSVEVAWTVTDEGTGVATVEYKLDNAAWEETTESSVVLSMSDGSHTVIIRATDNAGNWDTASVGFVVDTVDPTVSIDWPMDGGVVNTEDLEVTYTTDGTGSAVATVEIRMDSGSWEPADADSQLVTGLDEGDHTVEVRVTDEAGNDAVATADFTVDSEPPAIEITSPEEGQCFSIDSVTVEWTVTDAGSAVASVEYSLDDGSWQTATGDSATFTGLESGVHTVIVNASDTAGNYGEATVTFMVDVTDPTVAITAPSEGEVLGSSDVVVSWTADDALSGLDYVETRVDGGAWTVASGSSTTLSSLADGDHTVEVRATDCAGNTAVDDMTFTVDTTDPTVTIISPDDGSFVGTGDVMVTYSTDGTGSAIDSVEVSVDGGAWQSAGASSVTVSGLDDGDHVVEIRATDEAGNTDSATVEFTVDTTAPTVTITSPEADEFTGADVEVTWTVSDSGSSVDSEEVRIDGGDWSAASGGSAMFSDLGDGEHTVDVRATDAVGSEGTASVTFVVDVTAPSVIITSPADESVHSGTTVEVEWSASDAGSGIALVEVQLDDGQWTTATGGSKEFSTLAEGGHTVTVRVTDGVGNVQADSVFFMVDVTPPSLTITAPSTGLETRDATITITWTCTDSGCGIDRMEICIDGGVYTPKALAKEHTYDGLDAGEHTVIVRAYDNAGNVVEQSVTFTVTEPSSISAALIIGGILAVVIVVAVAMYVIRRRKASQPPQE